MFEYVCPMHVGHKTTMLTIHHRWTRTCAHGITPPCHELSRHLESDNEINFEGFQQHSSHASSFRQHTTHYNICCCCQKEKTFNFRIEFEATECSYSIQYLIHILNFANFLFDIQFE